MGYEQFKERDQYKPTKCNCTLCLLNRSDRPKLKMIFECNKFIPRRTYSFSALLGYFRTLEARCRPEYKYTDCSLHRLDLKYLERQPSRVRNFKKHHKNAIKYKWIRINIV